MQHLSFAVLLGLLLTLRTAVQGAPSGDSSNGFPHSPSDSTKYLVTQHMSIDPQQDFSVLDAETESLTFYSDDDEEAEVVDSSVEVVSSSLSDDGYILTSQALMCNGGDLFSSLPTILGESDDESDDDDDDDDGHSSMLSNASLKRARVSSNGAPASSSASERTSPASPSREAPLLKVHRHGAYPIHSALGIRGGATASGTLGSEFAKRLLVAAIVTLIYEALLGHFFEFVKIVMQTSPPGTTYSQVIRLITQDKGIAGIWDGFVPWGVIQAVFKGGVFGLAYAIASSFLLRLADEGKISKQAALTLAGGIAGGFQGYVLSPTLLLKTRVMTNDVFRESMSLWKTTVHSFFIGFDVVASEGMSALMKGANIFATKRVFDWATRYYFADLFASMMKKHKGSNDLTRGEEVACDLLGGVGSTLATLPLDVLVAKTQDAKKAGVSVSALSMFRDELKEGGWKGIMENYTSGFTARLAHVCCTTVAMKTGTGVVYDALFGKKKTQ